MDSKIENSMLKNYSLYFVDVKIEYYPYSYFEHMENKDLETNMNIEYLVFENWNLGLDFASLKAESCCWDSFLFLCNFFYKNVVEEDCKK